jgi:hypothetical protein
MQRDFERAIEAQNYFSGLVAMFRVFLHQRRRQDSGTSGMAPRPAEYPTPLDLQNVYCDSDPATPHWGC